MDTNSTIDNESVDNQTLNETVNESIIKEFSNVCEETCVLSNISANITLDMEVDNVILNISSISYTVEEQIANDTKNERCQCNMFHLLLLSILKYWH